MSTTPVTRAAIAQDMTSIILNGVDDYPEDGDNREPKQMSTQEAIKKIATAILVLAGEDVRS